MASSVMSALPPENTWLAFLIRLSTVVPIVLPEPDAAPWNENELLLLPFVFRVAAAAIVTARILADSSEVRPTAPDDMSVESSTIA